LQNIAVGLVVVVCIGDVEVVNWVLETLGSGRGRRARIDIEI
jgi:hypothetical protein